MSANNTPRSWLCPAPGRRYTARRLGRRPRPKQPPRPQHDAPNPCTNWVPGSHTRRKAPAPFASPPQLRRGAGDPPGHPQCQIDARHGGWREPHAPRRSTSASRRRRWPRRHAARRAARRGRVAACAMTQVAMRSHKIAEKIQPSKNCPDRIPAESCPMRSCKNVARSRLARGANFGARRPARGRPRSPRVRPHPATC